MGYFDEKQAILEGKVIKPYKNDDFDAFWDRMIKKSQNKPIKVKKTLKNLPYKNMNVYDVSYTTTDETVINAYFVTPKDVKGKIPCVIQFHGGNGKKSIQWEYPAIGMCCLSVDVRSQNGTSPDMAEYHSGGHWGNAMTRGVEDKGEFYLRNVYLDVYRAVEAVKNLEEVDPEAIYTVGGSQGGGLAIVAASLSQSVKRVVTIVPSYCCIRNRMDDRTGILAEITEYARLHPEYIEKIYDNVSYFDVLNFADKVKAKTLVGCSLSDPICLPHYVYSLYKALECEKEIIFAPYALHETTDQVNTRKLEFFLQA